MLCSVVTFAVEAGAAAFLVSDNSVVDLFAFTAHMEEEVGRSEGNGLAPNDIGGGSMPRPSGEPGPPPADEEVRFCRNREFSSCRKKSDESLN